jgi:hypothetical protein
MKYFEILKNQGQIQNKSIDREKSVCIFAINTNLKLYIWDNFKTENNQSFDYVYNKMKSRIDKEFGYSFINCEVYDWQKKTLKYEFTGNQELRTKLCDVHNAKVKLVIQMPTGIENQNHYHFESELNLSENEIVIRMKNRFFPRLKGQFNCLDFYKTVNSSFDTLIERINGNFINKYKAVG